jgi:small-conductance mechanosensitive channel
MNDMLLEHKLLASLILVLVILAVRWLLLRHLASLPRDEDAAPQRWINSVKNLSILIIGIGLMIIWLSELRYAALSIAAFAVAFVVATREFIQCFVGSVYQAGARLFTVGDWVRVGVVCGQVERSDWLCTTLLEIDTETHSYAYTGKSIVIPNNQFINGPVQNLNFMRRFVAHSFTITRPASEGNLFAARDFVLQRARERCEPFREVARRYSKLIEKRLGVQAVGPDATVRIGTNHTAHNVMTLTIYCPTQEALVVEQQLTADFMSYWYDLLEGRSRAAEQAEPPPPPSVSTLT